MTLALLGVLACAGPDPAEPPRDLPPVPNGEDTADTAPDCPLTPYWPDADGDGWVDVHGGAVYACEGDPPAGYATSPYADCTQPACEERWDDCDDTDPAVHSGAGETWYDGRDQNCDLRSDYDQDGDGFDSAAYGGADCDDVDDTRSPGQPERCDGDDDDCDGLVDGPRCGTEAGAADVDVVVRAGTDELGASDVDVVGDSDGDGVPEVVLTAYAPVAYVLGPPTAGMSVAGDARAVVQGVYIVHADIPGDLDGDGLADLLAVDWSARDDTVVFPGPLTGTLSIADATWSMGTDVHRPAAADIDGDGAIDLVDAGCVALGPFARGTDMERRCVATFEWGLTPHAAGDLDGDGVSDVVLVDDLDRTMDVFLGAHVGDGAFDTPDATWARDADMGTSPFDEVVAAGDLDGDGLDDLATVDPYRYTRDGDWAGTSGTLYGVLGPATGGTHLGEAAIRVHGERTTSYFGFALAALGDIDGDGRGDLAVRGTDDADGEANATIWVTTGLAPGAWSVGSLGAKWAAPDRTHLVDAAGGDFDGDGAPDLLFTLSPVGAPDAAAWFMGG